MVGCFCSEIDNVLGLGLDIRHKLVSMWSSPRYMLLNAIM